MKRAPLCRISTAALVALLLSMGCGDDGTETTDAARIDASASDATTGGDQGGPNEDQGTAGGDGATGEVPSSIGPEDRPATVRVPGDYDPAGSYPLVVLLHGYTASGSVQEAYFGLRTAVNRLDFISVLPDGLVDSLGNRYWNATDACCNVDGSRVDDVAYLTGLIDEAIDTYAIDPARVYLLGHSNGGFMSYRMTCDVAEKVTAIASLAGAAFFDPALCDPARPVSVLQIHGTLDSTVVYRGGTIGRARYPGARESVLQYAERAGCTGELMPVEPVDFAGSLPGEETTRETVSEGCSGGTDYALWSIQGGGHIPGLANGAIDEVLMWLFRHSR